MTPATTNEWFEYIAQLSDESLIRKGRAINTMDGVKSLISAGISPTEIEEILAFLALSFRERGMVIPKRYDGQYLELESLLPV